MTTDLAQVADDLELGALWAAIHHRLCAGADPLAIATITVPSLSPAGLAALRSWLDTTTRRRRTASAVTITPAGAKVPIRELLTVLRLTPDQLQPLVERAVGHPVVNRRDNRDRALRLRQELWAYAAEKLPHLPALQVRLKAAGFEDEDVAEVRRLVDVLAALTLALPCSPPRSLAKLAHDYAGDPHYLDLGTLPGARLTAAIAELTGSIEPTLPHHVRALLAQQGIIADRLSATVLLYRVHAIGDGPIDFRLREATAPVALTLMDLISTPPTLAPHVLTIVENPSVLEEAMARADSPPLACTSGQLRAVDHTLLQLAVAQGIPLRYAGDLDTSGFQIAETVQRIYGAELVAMDEATVLQAGAEPSAIPIGLLPASVHEGIAIALHAHARVVYQEHDAVLDRLLGPTQQPVGDTTHATMT